MSEACGATRSPSTPPTGATTPPSAPARVAAAALLTASAGASALWALRADEPRPVPLLVMAVASLGGLALVLALPALRRSVTAGFVTVLTVATLAVAVVPQPPLGADLWLYAVYGRTIVDHGESPYVHAPAAFEDDPWVQELSLYRDDESRYGPAFIAMTAAIAAAGGDSRLAVRLAYQVGAALAVVVSLLLLSKAGAPPAGLALLGLNPIVIVEVVSQGRNDAYVGLALLVAVVLARRRPHLAAVAIAGAALVKLPAGIALPALVAWVWWHHAPRKAGTVAAAGTAAVALGYLLAGGADALRPVLDARLDSNDVSIWVLFRENGVARALGDLSAELGPISSIQSLAPLLAITLTVLAVVPRVGDRALGLVLALPIVAYFLTTPYPSSWYVAWILPLLVLRLRSWFVPLTVGLFSVLLLRMHYAAALHVDRGDTELVDFTVPVEDGLLSLLQGSSVLLELVGIAGIVVAAVVWLRHRRPRGGREAWVAASGGPGRAADAPPFWAADHA